MIIEILPPTNDWVFKILFGDARYIRLLIALLKAYLKLPEEEYEGLILLDTYLKPEFKDDKMGILDVKLRTRYGTIIEIEIQVARRRDFGKRISYYKSKSITVQLGRGEWYGEIRKVICIVIMDYRLFEEPIGYLNHWRYYSEESGVYFGELPEEICTVEIPRVPQESDGSQAWKWTRFLGCRTKEEFEMIAKTDKDIRYAVDLLYELSADETVRREFDRREKERMELRALIEEGKAEGKAEGRAEGKAEKSLEIAKNLISLGLTYEQIAQATQLDTARIQALAGGV
jgi:predicted transposase/invertase (TIGR01784 family)